jgi:hypothetical protein
VAHQMEIPLNGFCKAGDTRGVGSDDILVKSTP